jgi:hypothetical protein
MKIVERTLFYIKSEGMTATIRRALVLLRRTWVDNKLCVYSVDLPEATCDGPKISPQIEAERKTDVAQISVGDMSRLLGNFGRDARKKQIEDRLRKGSTLWLAKCDGIIAGFGWSIQAKTIEPYLFPLAANDVHLFDYFVFPEFRGRGINVSLVKLILASLKKESVKRAFIETHVWNSAERRSLQKTEFRQIGLCRKLIIFKKPIVIWYSTSPS